jgi:hypothetical protein
MRREWRLSIQGFIVHSSSCILSPVEFAPLKRLGALLLIVLSACGKRGDPHPPVPVIPQATSDLVVAQRGDKVLLSWSYPSMTTAGKSLGAIRRVVLYRSVEEVPVTPPVTDTAKTTPPSATGTTTASLGGPFAKIPPIGPNQFNRVKEKVDTLEAARLPSATSGARLTYEDAPVLQAKDGRPVRLNYAVVTEGASARGDLSNIVHIVPLDVPLPPADVVATPKAEGVILTWSEPAQTIHGAPKPLIVGYNVYRVNPGQEPGEFDNPLNQSPIAATTYTDVPAYGSFQYHVTAVPASTGSRVESDLSAAATATFKDLVPPPTPATLSALVEPHAVQLVWDAVEASDLAGYKVYRTEGSGVEKLTPVATIALTKDPISATTFRDTTINVGISYFYEVASIDKNGNESKRVKTDWVLAPKTP